MQQQDKKEIFLNGRHQIFEMFEYLTKDEKIRYLRALAMRNPEMAQDLAKETLGFDLIDEINEKDWTFFLPKISPNLMALAMHSLEVSMQKNIFKNLPRDYAVKVFSMLKEISQIDIRDSKRAQKKIGEILYPYFAKLFQNSFKQ